MKTFSVKIRENIEMNEEIENCLRAQNSFIKIDLFQTKS